MIIGILIVLGLCFGSFINALVWRVQQQSLPKSKRPKNTNLSIVRGRSVCVNCQHGLSHIDLLPVVSWLALRGKCRYCKKSISWQYPLIEIITAIIFVASYMLWEFEVKGSEIIIFGLWLATVTSLVALALYDSRWMLLPNKIMKYSFGLATILALATLAIRSDSYSTSIINLILSVVISGGLFALLFYVSKGKWIGGGDVKLGFVLGLIVATPVYACLMLFLGSLLGCLVAMPAILFGSKTMQTKIPFGPFLIVATVVVYLFGREISEAYLRLLGLS